MNVEDGEASFLLFRSRSHCVTLRAATEPHIISRTASLWVGRIAGIFLLVDSAYSRSHLYDARSMLRRGLNENPDIAKGFSLLGDASP